MPHELTLLLVRHGETHYNAEGRFQGAQDIPLSDRGREQAQALQRRLTAVWQIVPAFLPGPPTHVFSSHLSRANETARILATALPAAAPVTVEPLLRERSYGNWEGLTTAEIRERYGPHTQPEGAEPLEEVRARITRAFQRIWQDTLTGRDHGVALVVGHGASLRYFFALALGISNDAVRRLQMDNTGLSVVTFRGESADRFEGRLLFLNDTSHLFGLGPVDRPRATPPR
jgi:broad specificity phosphatase PhoE